MQSYIEKRYKVILLGDSNVGKTSIMHRFSEGTFVDEYPSSIGVDFKSKTFQIDGENITLHLWDTAGQERFAMSIVSHYYRNANAVVLVYDVTNLQSFDSLAKWVEKFEEYCQEGIPRILIGNKCDQTKIVPTNKAQEFADRHNMLLFETSARIESECGHVESIFISLGRKLKNLSKRFPCESGTSGQKIGAKFVTDTTNRSCNC